jgi:16S rRNA processing protein RimM
MEKKAYLEIAKIINTHGVRGAVKLDPWCDSPETLKKIKTLYLENGKSYEVSNVKMINGGFVVLSLSGVMTVEDAVKLKNKILLAKREDIPVAEGAHFICDLIGCQIVNDETGVAYGICSDVTHTGSNDVYHLRTPEGREVLIPAIPDVIRKVDVEHETIRIFPMLGLFDDEI